MIISYEYNNMIKLAFSGISRFHSVQVHTPCDWGDKHQIHTTYGQDSLI